MSKTLKIIGILLVVLLLSSCANTIDVSSVTDGMHEYGFWGGLWHGMITPITFWIHLFDSDVTIFAINNNGGWYYLGFLIGVGGFAKGTSTASKRRRRR